MPITIDATVNGANANSYVTVDEFTSYCATRVPVVIWLATATADFIAVCIITGTRLFDASFDWTGVAATATQRLAWGRNGMSTRNGYGIDGATIPGDLKASVCEFIIAVGDSAVQGANRAGDDQAARANVAGVKAGPVEVRFQSVNTFTRESADVTIRRTWPELNYASLTVPDIVRYLLPESWYRRASVMQTIQFRVS